MQLIVDGNGLLHRSYHAVCKDQIDDTHSCALIGFVNMILSSIRDHKPTHIHIAWDTFPLGGNMRLKIYPAYKEGRDRDAEVYLQILKTRQLCDLANLPSYYQEGYEADDLIGALSKAIDDQVIIVTNDMDMMQLATNRVGVTKIRQSFWQRQVFYRGDVLGHYGIPPSQILDYKALCGDKSDNVPGVESIGDVWAKKLIDKYGGIHRLYAELPLLTKKDLPVSKLAALRAGEENAFMSYKLCSLMDVQVEPILTQLDESRIHWAMREMGISIEQYEPGEVFL